MQGSRAQDARSPARLVIVFTLTPSCLPGCKCTCTCATFSSSHLLRLLPSLPLFMLLAVSLFPVSPPPHCLSLSAPPHSPSAFTGRGKVEGGRGRRRRREGAEAGGREGGRETPHKRTVSCGLRTEQQDEEGNGGGNESAADQLEYLSSC